AVPAGLTAVLVNDGGHGFYRVRYAPDLLERLVRLLPEGLAPIERFNLVNDAWATTVAGLSDLSAYLDLTPRFRDQREKRVCSFLPASLPALTPLTAPADRPHLEAFVRDRLGPAVRGLGWAPQSGEDELTRQLRGDLLRAFGTLGNDSATQAQAAERY